MITPRGFGFHSESRLVRGLFNTSSCAVPDSAVLYASLATARTPKDKHIAQGSRIDDMATPVTSQDSESLLEALGSPERLLKIFSGFSIGGRAKEDGQADRAGEGAEQDDVTVESLEAKLLLSAQLGLALLEKQQQLVDENKAQQNKQKELEASVSQLLDRLASSYKENAQLIKRAERAQANLDASEASNRQLLITMEDDRKTIKRLTARSRTAARGDATEVADLQQELEVERRKSEAAEVKAKRAFTKLSENERRMATISQQLEKAKQDRIGRHPIAASRNRSRPSSISIKRASDDSDVDTYVQLIESLRTENDAMKTDMQELNDLLDLSRDQISALQAEQSEMSAFGGYDASQELSYASDSITGDTAFQPGMEPASASSTTLGGSEWPFGLTSSMPRGIRPLPHMLDESVLAGSSSSTASTRISQRRRGHMRTHSTSLRRIGGRAMSVDLTGMNHRRFEDFEYDSHNRSVSPNPNMYARSPSPSLKPFALGASASSFTSSFGSPVLPTAHEDARESEENTDHPTILEIQATPVKPPHQGEGGLSLSSPQKRRQGSLFQPSYDTHSKKEVAVQTDEVELPVAFVHSTPAHPRHALDRDQSSILSSDAASDIHQQENYNGLMTSNNALAGGSRTAALHTLIEYVVRLMTRLKAADIASLESRLKRQNLPGEVSHLAKSTMKDILTEIEDIRNHFRRVLDREASQINSDAQSGTSESTADNMMTRKDFIVLVRLFRDVLSEIGRLRLIVNKVQLEPHLAAKLKDLDAIQSASQILNPPVAAQTERTAAAALLAPLSRLWYGSDAQQAQSLRSAARPQVPKSKSSTKAVPKIGASSALAPTTVNVEFGGQGGIRRQVSIMPQATDGGLAGRYQESIGRIGPGHLARPARRDLSGIFAGGAAMNSPTSGSWVRVASGSGRQLAGPSRKASHATMSKNVDAVIDETGEDEFRPNLLERTLRPRGLSDSSIHSTFLSHANPGGRILTPAGLALSSATVTDPNHDGTIRATIAGNSKRSTSRKLSRDGAPSNSSTAPELSVAASDSTFDEEVTPSSSVLKSAPVNIHGSGGLDASTGLAKSPVATTPSGLFANLGAWASKTGSGLASSYHETSIDRWPVPRSSSATLRKPSNRDSDF